MKPSASSLSLSKYSLHLPEGSLDATQYHAVALREELLDSTKRLLALKNRLPSNLKSLITDEWISDLEHITEQKVLTVRLQFLDGAEAQGVLKRTLHYKHLT